LTIEQAYRVQLAILDRWVARGEQLAGWKVGLTAPVIQKQFGMHEPVMGFLLESGHRESGAEFRHAELIEPGFENELCLTVGTRLEGPDVTRAQARAAITAVQPAFEIIEARGDFRADLTLSLTDNCQQKAFVTGPASALPAGWEPASTTVEVLINGRRVDHAVGSEETGHPLGAVAWLAKKLAEFGRRLEPGHRIMSGSFTKQYPLARGDRIETRFTPFGTVRATFD
jgi:2-keto-4-pentenoate hydratase